MLANKSILKDKSEELCLKWFSEEDLTLSLLQKCFEKKIISVSYSEGLTPEEALFKVDLFQNPQLIFWYIGCSGLKKNGVDFYKKTFFKPLVLNHTLLHLWLLDLTAWNSFKERAYSIHKESSCCAALEELNVKKINCLKSSHLFKKMSELSGFTLEYLKRALARDFIHKSSAGFIERGITVGEVFCCPVMENWYELDVSKAYAVFQYLEGILIVEEILLKISASNLKEAEIVFMLPNDELKYYRDELGSFEEDLNVFMHLRHEHIKMERINITFLGFKYGDHIEHRPYNAPGLVLKKKDITLESILGIETI